MASNKSKVLVTVPTSPSCPYIHKHVNMVTDRLLADPRYTVTIMRPSYSPYENNLHHIVNDLMKGSCEWWLNIDSDNPPINNPLDLISLELDIVGLPTPVWHFDGNGPPGERPVYWNAWDYVPEKDAYKEHLPREGLQRVDAVGTGCVLISRTIFENPVMRKAPFQRQFNKDGTVEKGNDISFCERSRKAGFFIWAHYQYPCLHFTNLELNEVVRAFRNLYKDFD